MPWWGWISVGVLLLAAEMFAIDAQFYLIFIGAGAILVGLGLQLGIDLPVWGQWLSFAVISLISMFTLRKHLYGKLRGRAVGTVDSAIGSRVSLRESLEPGATCRMEYRGSTWTALNVGEKTIPADSGAVIDAVDGLTLRIRIVD